MADLLPWLECHAAVLLSLHHQHRKKCFADLSKKHNSTSSHHAVITAGLRH